MSQEELKPCPNPWCIASIKENFKSRVCEQIDLEQEGEDRFLVNTPFRFEDGDHYVIVLKKEVDQWILTDEASTIMHLSYWIDDKPLGSDAIGNRRDIMDNSLSAYSVQNRDGELFIPVSQSRFGDALFNFIQALTRVHHPDWSQHRYRDAKDRSMMSAVLEIGALQAQLAARSDAHLLRSHEALRVANDAYRQARNKVAMVSIVLPNGVAEVLQQCFAHYRTPEDLELQRAALTEAAAQKENGNG